MAVARHRGIRPMAVRENSRLPAKLSVFRIAAQEFPGPALPGQRRNERVNRVGKWHVTAPVRLFPSPAEGGRQAQ